MTHLLEVLLLEIVNSYFSSSLVSDAMRGPLFSFLIPLLVLIQSKTTIEDVAVETVAKAELSTTIFGQFGDAMLSYHQLGAVGKANFKEPLLARLFGSLGSTFAPIWGIVTLASQSLAGHR